MGNTNIIWHTRVNHCLAFEKEGQRLGIVTTSDDWSAQEWTVMVKHGESEPSTLIVTTLPEALQAAEQYALEWMNAAK